MLSGSFQYADGPDAQPQLFVKMDDYRALQRQFEHLSAAYKAQAKQVSELRSALSHSEHIYNQLCTSNEHLKDKLVGQLPRWAGFAEHEELDLQERLIETGVQLELYKAQAEGLKKSSKALVVSLPGPADVGQFAENQTLRTRDGVCEVGTQTGEEPEEAVETVQAVVGTLESVALEDGPAGEPEGAAVAEPDEPESTSQAPDPEIADSESVEPPQWIAPQSVPSDLDHAQSDRPVPDFKNF